MRREERLEKIKSILIKQGNASTTYLSKTINVSEATIRRDLTYICSHDSHIRKVHGGVVMDSDNKKLEYMFELKLKLNLNKKHAIAKKLIEIINDNDTLIMDSGTTCYYAAMELHRRDGLTVICTDIKIAEELGRYENIETIIGGGIVRPGYYTLGDNLMIDNLNQFNVKKGILAADAIDIKKGITNSSTFEVGVKRKLIEISDIHILLADSSKFGNSCLYKVADLAEIDTIITDKDIDKNIAEQIKKNGINLLIA